MTRVLITDAVDPRCVEILRSNGLEVDYRPGIPAEEAALAIAGAEVLIVRSQTQVTSGLLEAAKALRIVGRAGAGVDNIDVPAATRRGIIVMNTPGGNTVSTAEHTMSMMMALARNIPEAHQSVRAGRWERKKFVGAELFGKTLGVIGLGKVGAEVARRARAFDMKVIAYDPVLSSEAARRLEVTLVPLATLYAQADIITIHTPLTPETHHLVGREVLARCKRGVRIVNCARGGILDETALLEALESGLVAGAALDVFEEEPPRPSPLLQHPRVVLTPHLGASTEEAQEKVAVQIARQVVDALEGREIAGSVNADLIKLGLNKELEPFVRLAEKTGRFVAQLKDGGLRSVTVEASGGLLVESLELLCAAVVKGALEQLMTEPVNYLNALLIAKERGLSVVHRPLEQPAGYSNVLAVSYRSDREDRQVMGTVFGADDVRIVSIDGFHLEIKPQGNLILYSNIDRPGMLATVSALLARNEINIGWLSLGRFGQGQKALTAVSTDSPVNDDILRQLAEIDGVSDARRLHL